MDISKITDYLFIGAEPTIIQANELDTRNVRLIISMIGGRRPPEELTKPSYRLLWLQTFDTILAPIPISKLMQGVTAALPVVQSGGGVFVYCAQGRHRSVAMGAAILVAMGHSAQEAIHLIRTQRMVADPQAWHIQKQILRFESHWQDNTNSERFLDRLCERYSALMVSVISQTVLYFRLDKGPLGKRL